MKTKLYKVSTNFSSREINARSKKEAIAIFRRQLGSLVSDNDTILCNATLSDASFSRIDLSDVHFNRIDLSGAELSALVPNTASNY